MRSYRASNPLIGNKAFATCDPTFYKHTQRLFLELYDRNLAYQKEALVNYDPVDKTVLANEQVDANGLSWRSGAKVEQRYLKQWFFRISAYRDALLDDLDDLSGRWPERVLAMQRNWLGKSTGAKVKFGVNQKGALDLNQSVEVFTTRLDTIFGVQYVALSPSHPIVEKQAKTDAKLRAFLDTLPNLPPDSKAGYLLSTHAINPIAQEESTPDETKAHLPVYVAPYVLSDYGEGAVMGVPGHDMRDYAFWKENTAEAVRVVVESTTAGSVPFLHPGRLMSSGPYSGQTSEKANKIIFHLLESKNLASAAETWRLRDWLVSRQRYWGTPIPIIHCNTCGPVPVPIEDLPVELPPMKDHWKEGNSGNPLEHAHDWIQAPCPKCKGPGQRDTDTMDTFVDSSWYFMRFLDSKNEKLPFSLEAAKSLPVDVYVGGVEHAILHLLYARFVSKFIASTSLWPQDKPVTTEPFNQLITQGMVHGRTYSDPNTGRFLKPDEVDLSSSKPVVIATNELAKVSFEKMSKSKYNGVDPKLCIKKYGADATRAHMLFQAPVNEVLDWDEEKISGITRWLHRVWEHVQRQAKGDDLSLGDTSSNPRQYFLETAKLHDDLVKWREHVNHVTPSPADVTNAQLLAEFEQQMELWRIVQRTIGSVTESYGKTFALNTVVSDLMALTNSILDFRDKTPSDASTSFLIRHATTSLLQMMAPITPAFSEECWELMRAPRAQTHTIMETIKPYFGLISTAPDSIFLHPFPEQDGMLELLAPRTQTCAVQINGKLKFLLNLPFPPVSLKGKELGTWVTNQIMQADLPSDKKENLQTKDAIQKIQGAKKVIVVRGGKTVNFVV